MKKILCIALCLCMLFSVLTGCSSSGETAPAETAAAETKAAETQTAETKAAEAAAAETEAAASWQEEHPTWLCEEKITLNVFTFDGVNSNYLPPSNDLKFWQWLEDYTNVHIEWEIAPYSSYKDIIATKLGSGSDLADIIMIRFVAMKNDAADNGLLLNLSDYWDTCFTNTSAYFEERGLEYKSVLQNADGNLYAISNYNNPERNPIILLYNTEWMKKLGAEIPTTLDEFTDLLYKMKEAGDLNGNGKDDEIIFTASANAQMETALGTAFGLKGVEAKSKCMVDESGNVYDEYTSDNMKEYLKYMNQLYEDGILDPELATMNYDLLAEKCATDRVGIYACYSTFAVDYGQLTPAGIEDPTGEYYTLGTPLASQYNNNEGYIVYNGSFSGHTGINANCEYPEIACKWFDTLFADPAVLEARSIGWEGETFNRNADGSIELIPFADGQNWAPENFGGGQIALPLIQTSEELTIPYADEPWYIEEEDNIVNNVKYINMPITPVITFTEEENDLKTSYEQDVTSCYAEYRDKFISGEYAIDEKWDEYLDTMDKLGLPEVLKVYQSIYNRTK